MRAKVAIATLVSLYFSFGLIGFGQTEPRKTAPMVVKADRMEVFTIHTVVGANGSYRLYLRPVAPSERNPTYLVAKGRVGDEIVSIHGIPVARIPPMKWLNLLKADTRIELKRSAFIFDADAVSD